MEKHIEIETNVYHNYIDFKKAFENKKPYLKMSKHLSILDRH